MLVSRGVNSLYIFLRGKTCVSSISSSWDRSDFLTPSPIGVNGLLQETLVYQNGRVPLNNHNDVQTGLNRWFPKKCQRKKKFMKNHRSCRRHRIVAGTQRHPRRIIPKDESISQKTQRRSSQEFSTKQDPNKIILKDVDPKLFYQQKMTAPKKCKNIRWHLYNLLKPWKTLDFLLENACWMKSSVLPL